MAKTFYCPQKWSLQERLDYYTIPEALTGCYLCWAGRHSAGYALIHYKGENYYGHRLAWEFAFGPIPVGKYVLHRCDTPACVNPVHLFLGTQKDNADDREAKNRGNHAKGTRHASAKLTDQKAKEIYLSKEDGPTVADRYGVTRSIVYKIRRKEIWRHIHDH